MPCAIAETPRVNRLPRILVVDDDATFRMLAKRALRTADYDVVEASNGELGIQLYGETHPDLVLLDLMLPGIGGLEICSLLRARWGQATAPILMVTANESAEAIEAGYSVGVSDFFSKPVNWRLLIHRVRLNLEARTAMIGLRESQLSLANAQRIAHLGSWTWYVENDEMTWSQESFRILGLRPDQDHAGRETLWSRIHPDDREQAATRMHEAIRDRKGFECEHRILLPDGGVRFVRQQAEVRCDIDGEVSVVHGAIQDITEQTRAVDQIRYLANFDGLTGLSNRRLFRRNLHKAMKRARQRDESIAILFLDLDRFKRINETLGHTAGDQLIQIVAERLQTVIRRGERSRHREDEERSPLARLGGDEFTLLLQGISSPQDAALIAQRVLKALLEPIVVEGHSVTVTTSIGVAIFPGDGDDAETLIRSADTSMYRAKDSGGNRFCFFDDSMNATCERRLTLESQLRCALERDQLDLHFQPKTCLADGAVTGMEALLRWRHPTLGAVPPDEFIPMAEEAGLISPIGDWVLLQACLQNKAWQDSGHARIPVAVNVSTQQFVDGDLCASVRESLQRSGLEARYLELEITESAVVDDEEATVAILHQLKELGVRIALDDFGTGFSSLSYLKRFPLDTLKVDASFVRDLPDDVGAAGIAAAIIAMARVLDLHVVAEGVETERQRSFLHDCGCHDIQGYLVSPAVSGEDFARFLVRQEKQATP